MSFWQIFKDEYNARRKAESFKDYSARRAGTPENNAPKNKTWRLPPPTLLSNPPAAARATPEAMQARGADLIAALDSFGIRAALHSAQGGALVSIFNVTPAQGVTLNQFEARAVDLGRIMRAESCRISPNPAAATIQIELANDARAAIAPRPLFEALQNARGALPVILGERLDGAPGIYDLASMPHLLLAGTTGSGKSVLLHGILCSILARATPAQVRFILIDPKMLELAAYNPAPHMLAATITDSGGALAALNYLINEMESRYRILAAHGARNIEGFNESAAASERMPRLICVIDEYADLLAQSGKDFETAVQRIAQKARAAGIHLILATQRPSADVVTGVIKANFPARAAMRVPSRHDSRTIIDQGGAESLLGRGDMLFTGAFRPERLHAPFVNELDVDSIVNHWSAQGAPVYVTFPPTPPPPEKPMRRRSKK